MNDEDVTGKQNNYSVCTQAEEARKAEEAGKAEEARKAEEDVVKGKGFKSRKCLSKLNS